MEQNDSQAFSSHPGSPGVEVPSSGILRAVTSALFAYLCFAVPSFGITANTAKQIVGQDAGLLSDVVANIGWLLATGLGGFVAGYRAVGRGWIAGLLTGLYALAGLAIVFYFLTRLEGWNVSDAASFALLLFPARVWLAVAMLALVVPAAAIGGSYGDRFYREHGQLEDPARHTLFTIPWWHWVWLCLLLPAVFINDLVLSGHLLVLSGRLVLEHLRRLSLPPDLLVGIAPFVGFIATYFGLSVLWNGLSILRSHSRLQRFGRAMIGALLLLFGVNIVWVIASSILRDALKTLPP